jgi:hypothetical protein
MSSATAPRSRGPARRSRTPAGSGWRGAGSPRRIVMSTYARVAVPCSPAAMAGSEHGPPASREEVRLPPGGRRRTGRTSGAGWDPRVGVAALAAQRLGERPRPPAWPRRAGWSRASRRGRPSRRRACAASSRPWSCPARSAWSPPHAPPGPPRGAACCRLPSACPCPGSARRAGPGTPRDALGTPHPSTSRRSARAGWLPRVWEGPRVFFRDRLRAGRPCGASSPSSRPPWPRRPWPRRAPTS